VKGICEGTFRSIVHESKDLYNKVFINIYEEKSKFIGILCSIDGLYYCMINEFGNIDLISCDMNIEDFDYKIQ